MKKTMLSLGAVALLVFALSPVASSQSVKDPKGQNFKLFGSAQDAIDPENDINEVISTDTSGGAAGGAIRKLGTQVKFLDNEVQVKYLFESGTCGGGSPRIQLAVDTDGDGESDGNAFGYLGDKPFGGGCPPGEWVLEDMTNDQRKWDLSQFGGPMTASWDDMEAFFGPDHEVLTGALVDDTFAGSPRGEGVAFFDTVTIGRNTIDNHDDTNK